MFSRVIYSFMMNDGSSVVISSTTAESLVAVGIRATSSKHFDSEKFTHIERDGPSDSKLPRVVKEQCFIVNHRVGLFIESLQFCIRCGRYRTVARRHRRPACDRNLHEDKIREIHSL